MNNPKNDENDFNLLMAPGHLLRRNHQLPELFTQMVGGDVTRQQIALLIALTRRRALRRMISFNAPGLTKVR